MIPNIEREFLIQSNLIENVGEEGLADSIEAWEYVKERTYVTRKTIRKIHKLLMINLNSRIAGNFRKCNVRVGNRICPHYSSISIKINFLTIKGCAFNNFTDIKDVIEYCKYMHIEFEKLHPFEDGNGRVGRILYNWQRLKLGLPIHVIKYSERWEYYKWFE